MACVDVLMRQFPEAGGGRYMLWLVSPAPRSASWPPRNRNDQGWFGVHKLRDTRYWGRDDRETEE